MFKIRHGNSLYFLNTTPIYPRCETYCTDFIKRQHGKILKSFINAVSNFEKYQKFVRSIVLMGK